MRGSQTSEQHVSHCIPARGPARRETCSFHHGQPSWCDCALPGCSSGHASRARGAAQVRLDLAGEALYTEIPIAEHGPPHVATATCKRFCATITTACADALWGGGGVQPERALSPEHPPPDACRFADSCRFRATCRCVAAILLPCEKISKSA